MAYCGHSPIAKRRYYRHPGITEILQLRIRCYYENFATLRIPLLTCYYGYPTITSINYRKTKTNKTTGWYHLLESPLCGLTTAECLSMASIEMVTLEFYPQTQS